MKFIIDILSVGVKLLSKVWRFFSKNIYTAGMTVRVRRIVDYVSIENKKSTLRPTYCLRQSSQIRIFT